MNSVAWSIDTEEAVHCNDTTASTSPDYLIVIFGTLVEVNLCSVMILIVHNVL